MRVSRNDKPRSIGEMRFMLGMCVLGAPGALVAGVTAKIVYDEIRQSWSRDMGPTVVAVATAALTFTVMTIACMLAGGATLKRLGVSEYSPCRLFACGNKDTAQATAPVIKHDARLSARAAQV
ncbi:MAG: hypothetical protein P1U34_08150 [Coxiellaceae bacterium]|nr:hypothetical protein [Coxiellaceae bacterium]